MGEEEDNEDLKIENHLYSKRLAMIFLSLVTSF